MSDKAGDQERWVKHRTAQAPRERPKLSQDKDQDWSEFARAGDLVRYFPFLGLQITGLSED